MKYLVMIVLFLSIWFPAVAYDKFHSLDNSMLLAVAWSVACMVGLVGIGHSKVKML